MPRSAYRGLYIINWVYRYFTEPHYRQWLVWISGVVQTALYAGAWRLGGWVLWSGLGNTWQPAWLVWLEALLF